MAIALPLPRPAILRTTLVQRFWLAAGGLTLFIATVLVMRIAVTPSQPGEQVAGLDFLSFYTAGSALNEGRAADLFDLNATRQFQKMLGERDGVAVEGRYAPWWNPPFYAIVFRPIAHFRFQTGLAIWTLINLTCAALASMLLARLLPPRAGPAHTWLIGALLLISVPMFLALTHGQNTCTSLLLVTITVYLWRSNRAFAAGLVGGLLFYKPQLAAVIAIVMTIDLGWRALAGYIVTGSALLVTNLIALPGTLSTFLHTVPLNLAYVQNQCPYPWERHATFKAFWRVLFQSESIATTNAIVGLLSITCMAIVAIAFGRMMFKSRLLADGEKIRERLIAATIAATPLLMPFYFDYDLMLLAVPAVLFASEWIQSDEHSIGDRWLLGTFIALYLSLLIAPDLAERLRFNPLAPLLTLIVFLLIRQAGLPRSHSTSPRSRSDSSCRMPACS